MKIKDLAWDEKMFLAGCIKSAIMADGVFGDDELAELEELETDLSFSDFPAALEEFEASIKDTESFWEMAEEIQSPDARDLIVSVLRDISLREGFPNENEIELINHLEGVWE